MLLVAEGAEMTTVGAVVSTANGALGPVPGARLAAKSLAVPPPTEMPRVPSPLMPEIVTVREEPEPEMAIVPLAVPVLFNDRPARVSVLASKLASK